PPVMLGYAPPVNDVHNVPAIALDSQGILHIVLGAHGQPFGYRASLRPNDSTGGFTELVPVLSAGRIDQNSDADGAGAQTYISLVCGPDDTLHLAYRQWRQGVDPFLNGGLYAALSTQRKPAGQPWGPAQPMVAPVRPGYSIYYHKLTLDRDGGLWLSYCCYTADHDYQDDFPEQHSHRAVMTSPGWWADLEAGDQRRFPRRPVTLPRAEGRARAKRDAAAADAHEADYRRGQDRPGAPYP
ncbi:MAG: BNR repeat-containing protein, partial [Gammaproteobacteria bacterium]|nr:BNR repeat-containing protein [Gammaproteobacteria bacterium]